MQLMSQMLLVALVVLCSCSFSASALGTFSGRNMMESEIAEFSDEVSTGEQRRQMAPVPKGVVKLDNYTLDKARALPGLSWLVMVDSNWSQNDINFSLRLLRLETFTANAGGLKNLVIGKIPVQCPEERTYLKDGANNIIKRGHLADENKGLAESLGVNATDFPTFFLFSGSSQIRFYPEDSGRKFYERKDWDDLAVWMRSHGVLVPSMYTIADMDKLVAKFVQTDFGDEAKQEAKKLAEGEHKYDKKAAVYVRLMEKVQKNGIEYIATETARVKQLVQGVALLPEKKNELKEKLNVLQMFHWITAEDGTPQIDPDAQLKAESTAYRGVRAGGGSKRTNRQSPGIRVVQNGD